jgi:hypothetical protein
MNKMVINRPSVKYKEKKRKNLRIFILKKLKCYRFSITVVPNMVKKIGKISIISFLQWKRVSDVNPIDIRIREPIKNRFPPKKTKTKFEFELDLARTLSWRTKTIKNTTPTSHLYRDANKKHKKYHEDWLSFDKFE